MSEAQRRRVSRAREVAQQISRLRNIEATQMQQKLAQKIDAGSRRRSIRLKKIRERARNSVQTETRVKKVANYPCFELGNNSNDKTEYYQLIEPLRSKSVPSIPSFFNPTRYVAHFSAMERESPHSTLDPNNGDRSEDLFSRTNSDSLSEGESSANLSDLRSSSIQVSPQTNHRTSAECSLHRFEAIRSMDSNVRAGIVDIDSNRNTQQECNRSLHCSSLRAVHVDTDDSFNLDMSLNNVECPLGLREPDSYECNLSESLQRRQKEAEQRREAIIRRKITMTKIESSDIISRVTLANQKRKREKAQLRMQIVTTGKEAERRRNEILQDRVRKNSEHFNRVIETHDRVVAARKVTRWAKRRLLNICKKDRDYSWNPQENLDEGLFFQSPPVTSQSPVFATCNSTFGSASSNADTRTHPSVMDTPPRRTPSVQSVFDTPSQVQIVQKAMGVLSTVGFRKALVDLVRVFRGESSLATVVDDDVAASSNPMPIGRDSLYSSPLRGQTGSEQYPYRSFDDCLHSIQQRSSLIAAQAVVSAMSRSFAILEMLPGWDCYSSGCQQRAIETYATTKLNSSEMEIDIDPDQSSRSMKYTSSPILSPDHVLFPSTRPALAKNARTLLSCIPISYFPRELLSPPEHPSHGINDTQPSARRGSPILDGKSKELKFTADRNFTDLGHDSTTKLGTKKSILSPMNNQERVSRTEVQRFFNFRESAEELTREARKLLANLLSFCDLLILFKLPDSLLPVSRTSYESPSKTSAPEASNVANLLNGLPIPGSFGTTPAIFEGCYPDLNIDTSLFVTPDLRNALQNLKPILPTTDSTISPALGGRSPYNASPLISVSGKLVTPVIPPFSLNQEEIAPPSSPGSRSSNSSGPQLRQHDARPDYLAQLLHAFLVLTNQWCRYMDSFMKWKEKDGGFIIQSLTPNYTYLLHRIHALTNELDTISGSNDAGLEQLVKGTQSHIRALEAQILSIHGTERGTEWIAAQKAQVQREISGESLPVHPSPVFGSYLRKDRTQSALSTPPRRTFVPPTSIANKITSSSQTMVESPDTISVQSQQPPSALSPHDRMESLESSTDVYEPPAIKEMASPFSAEPVSAVASNKAKLAFGFKVNPFKKKNELMESNRSVKPKEGLHEASEAKVPKDQTPASPKDTSSATSAVDQSRIPPAANSSPKASLFKSILRNNVLAHELIVNPAFTLPVPKRDDDIFFEYQYDDTEEIGFTPKECDFQNRLVKQRIRMVHDVETRVRAAISSFGNTIPAPTNGNLCSDSSVRGIFVYYDYDSEGEDEDLSSVDPESRSLILAQRKSASEASVPSLRETTPEAADSQEATLNLTTGEEIAQNAMSISNASPTDAVVEPQYVQVLSIPPRKMKKRKAIRFVPGGDASSMYTEYSFWKVALQASLGLRERMEEQSQKLESLVLDCISRCLSQLDLPSTSSEECRLTQMQNNFQSLNNSTRPRFSTLSQEDVTNAQQGLLLSTVNLLLIGIESVREGIISLVPHRTDMANNLRSRLDVEMLRSLLSNPRLFTVSDWNSIFQYIGQQIASLEAPARNKETCFWMDLITHKVGQCFGLSQKMKMYNDHIDATLQDSQKSPADAFIDHIAQLYPSTMDLQEDRLLEACTGFIASKARILFNAHEAVALQVMPRFLAYAHHKIALIRVDMANAQLAQLGVYLSQGGNGVEYERSKFDAALERGEVTLHGTKAVMQKSISTMVEMEAEYYKPILHLAESQTTQEELRIRELYEKAISRDPPQSIEDINHNVRRAVCIDDRLQRLAIIRECLLHVLHYNVPLTQVVVGASVVHSEEGVAIPTSEASSASTGNESVVVRPKFGNGFAVVQSTQLATTDAMSNSDVQNENTASVEFKLIPYPETLFLDAKSLTNVQNSIQKMALIATLTALIQQALYSLPRWPQELGSIPTVPSLHSSQSVFNTVLSSEDYEISSSPSPHSLITMLHVQKLLNSWLSDEEIRLPGLNAGILVILDILARQLHRTPVLLAETSFISTLRTEAASSIAEIREKAQRELSKYNSVLESSDTAYQSMEKTVTQALNYDHPVFRLMFQRIIGNLRRSITLHFQEHLPYKNEVRNSINVASWARFLEPLNATQAQASKVALPTVCKEEFDSCVITLANIAKHSQLVHESHYRTLLRDIRDST